VAEGDRYPWYDGRWLGAYAAALRILSERRPELVEPFEQALAVLRVPPSFETRELPGLLDPASLGAFEELIRGFGVADVTTHEATTFGRLVVHDHPVVLEVQHQLLDLASRLAGEPLVPSYTFVSLYTGSGVCAVHLDAPPAKWTLDLCVRQSEPWPLHVSQPVPWPVDGVADEGWEARVLGDPGLRFRPVTLEPGGAVFFGGSSQWHHRAPHPGAHDAYCDLVFLHFIPAGTEDLVRPEAWATLFDAPELEGLTYGEVRVTGVDG
jgi:hypothetical protein